MLSASDTPIEDVLPYFTSRGIDVAFLVPTDTGISHSAMDAIASVRQFLVVSGVHDYGSQAQGMDSKVRIPSQLIVGDRIVPTTASLYRPPSGDGDPRIWFDGLTTYVQAYNLLALVSDASGLLVFNMSSEEVIASLESGGAVARILDDAAPDVDALNTAFERSVDMLLDLNPARLRDRATAAGSRAPQQHTTTTRTYYRNPDVAAWARARAEGVCDLCSSAAPFLNKKGQPYLVTHHVVWLSRSGADSVDNVVALCPNCHARVHSLDGADDRGRLAAKYSD